MARTFTISPEVRAILAQATVTETTVKLNSGQLDRATYVAVNKVLEAAGGKWNRKQGLHTFARDPRADLGLAVETGKTENRQQVLQAFYTPDAVADRVAELADVDPLAHAVLEPSAGHGALLDAVARRSCQPRGAVALDIDPEAVAILHEKEYLAIYYDFLATPTAPIFDRVLMNPPFTQGADVAHVTHALGFLKPGGRLVAIMGPSWRWKDDVRSLAFRNLLGCNRFADARFDDVPAGAFKASGTDIATVIVTVDRAEV